VDSAPKSIHGHRAGERHQRLSFGLTRWVKDLPLANRFYYLSAAKMNSKPVKEAN
jgi:hypothetical protein